jgi:hypothetical protein
MLWWEGLMFGRDVSHEPHSFQCFARESKAKYFPRSQSMDDWDRNTIGNVENKAKRG